MTTEAVPARGDTHYRGGMSATDQVDVRGHGASACWTAGFPR